MHKHYNIHVKDKYYEHVPSTVTPNEEATEEHSYTN